MNVVIAAVLVGIYVCFIGFMRCMARIEGESMHKFNKKLAQRGDWLENTLGKPFEWLDERHWKREQKKRSKYSKGAIRTEGPDGTVSWRWPDAPGEVDQILKEVDRLDK